jgi:hypothetical protein
MNLKVIPRAFVFRPLRLKLHSYRECSLVPVKKRIPEMISCNASILSSGCAKRSFARRVTVSFSCLLFLVGFFPEVGACARAQTPQKNVALVQPTQGAEDVRSLEEGKLIERDMSGARPTLINSGLSPDNMRA